MTNFQYPAGATPLDLDEMVGLKIKHITPRMVEAFRAKLIEDKYSRPTVNNYMMILRSTNSKAAEKLAGLVLGHKLVTNRVEEATGEGQKPHITLKRMERVTGFEPATPSLGSLYSTN